MRSILLRLVAWLLLLAILAEANWFAHSLFFAEPIDVATGLLKLGTAWTDFLLLVTCFASFFLGGFALCWVMGGDVSAVPSAMALGCVWVAADIALRFPWYQLLPSHPAAYDHMVAFLGAICAPVAAALGSLLFRTLFNQRDATSSAT